MPAKYIPAPRFKPTSYVEFFGMRCMVVDVLDDGGYVVCVIDGNGVIARYTIMLVERKLESDLTLINSH
jgi:hypothetical protein